MYWLVEIQTPLVYSIMQKTNRYAFGLIGLLFASCSTVSDSSDQTAAKQLFVQRASEDTGVTFSNDLSSGPDMNIIEYLYYYNGAGVAVADFNNDGLEDLFFAGNEASDRMYLNLGELKFQDITDSAGIIGDATWSTGVTVADVNADGYVDIYVSAVGDYKTLSGENRLYLNNGDLTFSEVGASVGLDFKGFGTQASFFDYDNDGDLDVYLLNHTIHTPRNYGKIERRAENDPLSGDRLYENTLNETGVLGFVEVTEKAGIYSSALGYGLALSTTDLNGDGWVDIYVGNDFHENDYIYLNNTNKTFSEVSKALVTSSTRFTMGIDVADLNNDLRADLFTLDMMPNRADVFMKSGGEDSDKVAQIKREFGYHEQLARNHLQLGTTNGFSEVALATGVYATDWSWSVLLEDFDNDSNTDVFISNGIYKRPNDLDFINFQSNVTFSDSSSEAELEQQLIEQMPMLKIENELFLNRGNLSFERLDPKSQFNPSYSNGAAVADLDNDGDLDLVVNTLSEPAHILENTTSGNFIQFSVAANALNAKLVAYVGQIPYYKEITATRGYASASSTRVHLGLGSATVVDSLMVYHLDGTAERYTNLEAGKHHILKGGETLQQSFSLPAQQGSYTVTPFAYTHKENAYLDYEREPLMPERLSIEGPAYTRADFTGDGLDDLFFGGAKMQPAELWVQTTSGDYVKADVPVFIQDFNFEDVDSAAFDFDADGDLDLYVMSGGNELYEGEATLMDRLYINDGAGDFVRFPATLPSSNGGSISAADFSGDGYADLFIGNRSIPGGYGLSPTSAIVASAPESDAYFEAVAQAPLGMVTDSEFVDINADGFLDLVVVGDFMPVTILLNDGNGSFSNQTTALGLGKTSGFWNTVEVADINGDGRLDLLAGNAGINHKWKPSQTEPVVAYLDDFDGNSSLDPILFYSFFGQPVPFASKDKLVSSLPYLKKKFLKYSDFASVTDIVSLTDKTEIFETKAVVEMRSMVFIQQADGTFSGSALPFEAQLSTIEDFYAEGTKVYYVGNYSGYVSELGPSLSNAGGVLSDFDGAQFQSHSTLGLPLGTEARAIDRISDEQLLIVVNNGPALRIESKN